MAPSALAILSPTGAFAAPAVPRHSSRPHAQHPNYPQLFFLERDLEAELEPAGEGTALEGPRPERIVRRRHRGARAAESGAPLPQGPHRRTSLWQRAEILCW